MATASKTVTRRKTTKVSKEATQSRDTTVDSSRVKKASSSSNIDSDKIQPNEKKPAARTGSLKVPKQTIKAASLIMPHELPQVKDFVRKEHVRPKAWYRYSAVDIKEHKITLPEDIKAMGEWLLDVYKQVEANQGS